MGSAVVGVAAATVPAWRAPRIDVLRAIGAGFSHAITEPTTSRSYDRPADRESEHMLIRTYRPDDAAPTLELLERAITTTGRARYTQAQVEAWIGPPRGLAEWNDERMAVQTVVAEEDESVAGFADLDEHGYVNRLFIDPRFGRRGVARALLEAVRSSARTRGLTALTTHASLIARPVFERAGFRVVHEETVRRGDVELVRFSMRAPLTGSQLADETRTGGV